MPIDLTIFTIGHSRHSREHFEWLLQSAGITGVADVRSVPFSRLTPHFSQSDLKYTLRNIGIVYSFLGRELGGRPQGHQLYCEGVADYEKMARTPTFMEGIARVLEGARKYRVALLCSEHDPLDCHRCLLVGRQLAHMGVRIEHILSNGSLQSQDSVEETLLKLVGGRDDDLFLPREERLAIAYRERGRRIAFSEPRQNSVRVGESR